MTVCARKDCSNEGDRAPRVTLKYEDDTHEYEIPVVISLVLCTGCRERFTGGEFLTDAFIEMLRQEKPWTKYVGCRLEWLELTHPDYVDVQRARPN